MEAEALAVVYLYLGIGLLLLLGFLAVYFFRKVKIIMETMHMFVQLMIGLYEQEKQKNEKTD